MKKVSKNKLKYLLKVNNRKLFDIFELIEIICLELRSSLNGEPVEAILNVAGGWAGGNAGDKSKQKPSYF